MAKQKPKLKTRSQSRGKITAKKAVRSKSRTHQKTRARPVAKREQRISSRITPTRHKKKITDDGSNFRSRNSKSKNSRQTSRIKISNQGLDSKFVEKKRIKNRSWSEPVGRAKKNSGYTSKIHIAKSKVRGAFTLKKSETSLTKKNSIRMKRGESQKSEVTKKLGNAAKRKFKSLGKSKENLRMVKLQYTYTLNGKRRKSYFSSTVAKLESEEDVQKMLEILVEDFESRLKSYENSGFSDIRISGVRMHAYEE